MQASANNPIYTVYVLSNGTKYNITPAVESIDTSDQRRQFSNYVNITVANTTINGTQAASFFKVRDTLFIYANDGDREDEVFRGFIWTIQSKANLSEESFSIKAYDFLIYLQETECNEFYEDGGRTELIIRDICKNWGLDNRLKWQYSSKIHDQLVLRGTLSEEIQSILDEKSDSNGQEYVMLCDKGYLIIRFIGHNQTVYTLRAGDIITEASSECTMDGMTTKVVILGKAKNDEKATVEATQTGDIEKYGTLQKNITLSDDKTLINAKGEATALLRKYGKPQWEYEITARDIPWIRKGDKINISAANITGAFFVEGIDRTITNKRKEMSLTLTKYDPTRTYLGDINDLKADHQCKSCEWRALGSDEDLLCDYCQQKYGVEYWYEIKHKCIMCGEDAPTPEEDLLCDHCQHIYGVERFSELPKNLQDKALY